MAENEQTDVAALTVQLLSAYLANNNVAHTDLAELVRSTKAALVQEAGLTAPQPEATTYTPAVSARRSLASPDQILSLIDGKPYKTLKRHLSSHGLTPESYRQRYGLPASYPMVAPSFAAERRAIAEKIGLGRRTTGAAPASETNAAPTETPVGSSSPAEAIIPAIKPKRAKAAAKASGTKPENLIAAGAPVASEPSATDKAEKPTKPLAKVPAKKVSVVKAKAKAKSEAPSPAPGGAASATVVASAPSAITTASPDAKPEAAATTDRAPVPTRTKAAPRRDTLKLFKEAAAKLPPKTSKAKAPAKAVAAKAPSPTKAPRRTAKTKDAVAEPASLSDMIEG